MRNRKIYIQILLVTVYFLSINNLVFAQNSSVINATVQVSICGNGMIEGGEDCEGQNLNNKSCASLGYSGGTLSCDISCSFDTSACIPPTPTPTPTKSPDQALNSTSSSSISSSSPSPSLPAIPTPTPYYLPNSYLPGSAIESIIRPAKLSFFDPNGDGIIEQDELYASIKLWTEEWRKFLSIFEVRNGKIYGLEEDKKCDINNDKYCDLVDLSILLFYVEK